MFRIARFLAVISIVFILFVAGLILWGLFHWQAKFVAAGLALGIAIHYLRQMRKERNDRR